MSEKLLSQALTQRSPCAAPCIHTVSRPRIERWVGRWAAIATCLALTFLNPHVYLDTVLLIGGLSGQYDGSARTAFGAGAVISSFVWFFSLGYGARLLAPVFAKPVAWRVLDLLIAAIMAFLGAGLLLDFLNP